MLSFFIHRLMLKNRKGFLLAEDDMCGRFTLAMSPEDIAALLRLNQELDDELGLSPQHNIAPSQNILAAVQNPDHGTPEPTLLQWGLVPSWADDPSVGNRMINARSETAAEKPSFRDAFHSRRCLIPFTGWFEWLAEGKRKQPYHISLESGPFAVAGLWEISHRAAPPVTSCTIVTCPANDVVARYHPKRRMPAILKPEDWETWLDTRTVAAEFVQDLLPPWPNEDMTVHKVDPRHVNATVDTPLAVREMEEKT